MAVEMVEKDRRQAKPSSSAASEEGDTDVMNERTYHLQHRHDSQPFSESGNGNRLTLAHEMNFMFSAAKRYSKIDCAYI